MNEKSLSTKGRILECAKKQFYTLGYKKSTIRIIAKEADVPISLITYYFNSKESIVKEIYSTYITNIMALFDRVTEGKIKNHLLRQMSTVRIYYEIMLNDENNKKFLYEIQKNESNYNSLYDIVHKGYEIWLNEYDIYCTEKIFRTNIIAEFGARNELLIRYLENELKITTQELSVAIITIAPKLFNIDPIAIDSLVLKSAQLFESIDYSSIKFLA